MSLKNEPSSEPLQISTKQLFLRRNLEDGLLELIGEIPLVLRV